MKITMLVLGISCIIFGFFLNSIFESNTEHNQIYGDLLLKLKNGEYKLTNKDGIEILGECAAVDNDKKENLNNKNFVFVLEDMEFRTPDEPNPGVRNLNKEEIKNMIYTDNVKIKDIFEKMDKKRKENQTCLSMHMFSGYKGKALNLISILGDEKSITPIHAINLEVLYPKKVAGEDNKTLKIKVNPNNVKTGYKLKVKENIIINYINPLSKQERVRKLSGKVAIDLQIVYYEITGIFLKN